MQLPARARPTQETREITCAGRHELLEHEGLEHHPEIPAYALSELKLKYKRPLRSQDDFVITVSTVATGRTKVDFEQRIIRLDKDAPDGDSVRLLMCQWQYDALRRARCVGRGPTHAASFAVLALAMQHNVQPASGNQKGLLRIHLTTTVQVVLEAKATVVLLTEAYRPLRMPAAFRDAVGKYMAPQPA